MTVLSSHPTEVAPIRRVEQTDGAYPVDLLHLPKPPARLYAIGNLDLLGKKSVSIVGTRHPSAYGVRVVKELATAFVRADVVVVSGMAIGIDALAHEAALAEGGDTVAVLGTGVDVPYPELNVSLHRRLCERGLVISEQSPGSRAHRGSFPKRNRLIAALSDLTIVVEAGARSGALITATIAAEINRKVGAIPGRIDSPHSAGTNGLLRDGATAITTIDEALSLAEVAPPLRVPRGPLPDDQQKVWDALAGGPAEAELLSARTGLPARDCVVAISSLEVMGLVECLLTGEVQRR